MDILDLDEAQGLTAEIARAYLERTAWTIATLADIWPARWTKCGETVWVDADDLSITMRGLARVEQRSVQAILREINPRLRKGVPSEAAQAAHGGRWIACRSDEYKHTTIVRILHGMGSRIVLQFESHQPNHEISSELDLWSFWPCDSAGNKVRWPERDGVML